MLRFISGARIRMRPLRNRSLGWKWIPCPWLVLICALVAVPAAADDRPNIVVIMADDIGVECLSCYGGKDYETPHLDRLAASGMRFENAHAQPICTPSRVQIMTGIYNNRNYIRFGLLDPAAITFGNVLRGAGYETCIAGKWQLKGGLDAPRRFGFDRYCLWQLTRRPSRYPNPGLEIDGVERDFKDGQFGPDVVSDYVVDFISQPRDGPFLVYYPMIAPHWPFVPTPDHPDWDPTMWRDAKGEPGGYRRPKYWDAMVRYTDKMVGKVIDGIERAGLRENTLIIWTGDNGTFTNISSEFRGRTVRGGKGSTTDNGTHVGFLASLPGVIPPGSVSETLVDFADVFPTLLEVAGVPTPPTVKPDGVSLAPAWGGQPRSKEAIYCWYQRNGVRQKASQHSRNARFKLYADGRFFDVIEDPAEQNDLATGEAPQTWSRAVRTNYELLAEHLKGHRRVTEKADPIQEIKRQRWP